MDNYYTSPELFEELHFRETYACGTVRANRKGLPEAPKISKLKKGDGHFQRNRPVLAIRWCDKRAFFMLSTIHDAKMVERNNPDFEGRQVVKPKCVVDYCHFMGGVDLADQVMSYYSFLRRTVKWWQKLFVHLFNMIILNSYVLFCKYGNKNMSHDDFREELVQKLIDKGMKTSICQHHLSPVKNAQLKMLN